MLSSGGFWRGVEKSEAILTPSLLWLGSPKKISVLKFYSDVVLGESLSVS